MDLTVPRMYTDTYTHNSTQTCMCIPHTLEIKNNPLWSVGTVPSVKCWPHNYENMSLIFRTQVLKQSGRDGTDWHTQHRELETGGFLGFPGQPVRQPSPLTQTTTTLSSAGPTCKSSSQLCLVTVAAPSQEGQKRSWEQDTQSPSKPSPVLIDVQKGLHLFGHGQLVLHAECEPPRVCLRLTGSAVHNPLPMLCR